MKNNSEYKHQWYLKNKELCINRSRENYYKKRVLKESNCLNCNIKIISPRRNYCSNRCYLIFKKNEIKETHLRATKKWDNLNKIKRRAYNLANKKKKILKKEYCEICFSKKSLHMHHKDYSKPLEVVTLCSKCHSEEHYGN